MQVVAFVPLAYMCVCTYFSLIRLGMMTIYYLAPKHTSSVSLLMLCSMVARYAAPLCYNFLYLIRLRTRDGKPSLTVFETKMGTMTASHNGIDSQNDTVLEQVSFWHPVEYMHFCWSCGDLHQHNPTDILPFGGLM
jgi:hypothetical protein